MLYHDRIDIYINEGIDFAKSNKSKECMICHHWFFNHEFKFQDFVCIRFLIMNSIFKILCVMVVMIWQC